ncbi:M48 family metallopeptidase [Ascidiimonas aurantiaca]|uniref:M48 family metallopeptidase n=1 Tax=Ascidiimonas aurantiaca TaxID=1685432 RepID=UPI0030EB69AE
MLAYILAGFVLYMTFMLVRIVLVSIVALHYKEPITEHLTLKPVVVIAEVFFFSIIFACALWLIKDFMASSGMQILIAIFFVALIPSYNYIITPLKYLFSGSKYRKDEKLTQFLKNFKCPYNVRIIKGNVINAYATGVLPFSKTILVGENLVNNMPEEEVQSILLHEVGHLKGNHLFKLYFLNVVLATFSFLFFFTQQKAILFEQMGIPEPVVVIISGVIVGLLFWYFPGKIQYYFEYQADLYAAKRNGVKRMINALHTLDRLSNGEVSKGGITHPTLTKRIHSIKRQNEK